MATGAKGFFCPSSGADCSNHFRYELVLQQKLSDYVGLLTVEWNVGARSWIQHAAKQNKTVREIRAKRSEKEWPGFRNFIEPLKDIDKIPKAWQEILTHSQGIYLLTCQNTGMRYIGSAKSEKGGFWQRFCAYKKDGHGGNKELKNFDTSHMQITILERVDPGNMQIVEIETTWKNKLRTRVSHGPQGLNAN
jgi:hypothetical protein